MQLLNIRRQQQDTSSTTSDGSKETLSDEWLNLPPSCFSSESNSSQDSAFNADYNSINNNSAAAIEQQQLSKRIFLVPKLAYRSVEWDENGTPEDVLLTLSISVQLCTSILPLMSYRARCNQSVVEALDSLRKMCIQMLRLLTASPIVSNDSSTNSSSVGANNSNNVSSSSTRSILHAVSETLLTCAQSLVTPTVFCHANSSTKESSVMAVMLADLLRESSNNNEDTAGMLKNKSYFLWLIFSTIVRNFDHTSIELALDHYVLNDNDNDDNSNSANNDKVDRKLYYCVCIYKTS